jgi:inosose dehydratase
MNRENFLKTIPALLTIPSLIEENFTNVVTKTPITASTYDWITFYEREGRKWGENLDNDIAEFAKSGVTAIEPSFDDVNVALEYLPIIKKYNLALPSVYVNSVLHEEDQAEKSINTILTTATELKKHGTKIIVTNPTPIQWGATEKYKSNDQLKVQAKSLDLLGSKLRNMGISLSYHTHDMEMLAGAREFHHMMQNTNPLNMTFCMDLHWIFRGSKDSELAVFDVIKMYGRRISELHIRQSNNGVWSETFSPKGDIDYERVVIELNKLGVKPHLCIEQSVERKSPKTMDALAAHIINLKEIKSVFGRK